MEQRKAPRNTAGLWAVVSCPQFGLFRGQIDNLSSTGLHLRADIVRVCLNAPVTVTFQPDEDDPRRCFNADGVVVREDVGGIGIEFSALDEVSREILQELQERLPDQEELFSGSPERIAV
jgi:hypothetical protein